MGSTPGAAFACPYCKAGFVAEREGRVDLFGEPGTAVVTHPDPEPEAVTEAAADPQRAPDAASEPGSLPSVREGGAPRSDWSRTLGVTRGMPPPAGGFGARLGTLVGSAPFLALTALYVPFVLVVRAAEAQAFATGLALPLYLVQCIRHRLLPRPPLSRHAFAYRHPVVTAALAAVPVVALAVTETLVDEAAALLFGLLISAPLVSWCRRDRIFREPAESPWSTPPAVAVVPSADSPGTAPAGRPARPRSPSLMVALAFVVALLAGAASVSGLVLNAFVLDALPALVAIDYDALRAMLGGLWSTPEQTLLGYKRLLYVAWFAPMAVALMAWAVAFLVWSARKTRGGPLLVVTLLLTLGQGLVNAGALHALERRADRYARAAHSTADVSAPGLSPVERLARFHGIAVRHAAGAATGAEEQLVRVALSADLTTVERMAALALLETVQAAERFHGDDGADENAWWRQLAASARNATDRTLRHAFSSLLSHCPEEELRDLFWDQFASDWCHGACASPARRWFTRVAPLAAIQWMGRKCRALPERQLDGWLRYLEHAGGARFQESREVRDAMLAPLLDHSDEHLRLRAARLLRGASI